MRTEYAFVCYDGTLIRAVFRSHCRDATSLRDLTASPQQCYLVGHDFDPMTHTTTLRRRRGRGHVALVLAEGRVAQRETSPLGLRIIWGMGEVLPSRGWEFYASHESPWLCIKGSK